MNANKTLNKYIIGHFMNFLLLHNAHSNAAHLFKQKKALELNILLHSGI